MTIRKLDCRLGPPDAITVVLTKPQIVDTVAIIVIKRHEAIVKYEFTGGHSVRLPACSFVAVFRKRTD